MRIKREIGLRLVHRDWFTHYITEQELLATENRSRVSICHRIFISADPVKYFL